MPSELAVLLKGIRGYFRKYRRAIFASLLALTFVSFVFVLFVIVSYAATLSINAIVDTATSLLTVEGFLLALSPLIEDKKARILRITVGRLAIMSSLITIVVARAVLGLQALYPQIQYKITRPAFLGVSSYQYFVISGALFITMLEMYWLSMATLGVERKRDWEKNSEILFY